MAGQQPVHRHPVARFGGPGYTLQRMDGPRADLDLLLAELPDSTGELLGHLRVAADE